MDHDQEQVRRLTSPSTIKYYMEKHGFRFSKRWGQNFLISEATVQGIVEGARLSAEDQVLEIGPGLGVMTDALAKVAKQVVSVEIDSSLEPVLADTVGHHPNVHIEFADFMRLNLSEFFEAHFGARPPKVVANLPYYITTPILMHLLESDVKPADIVIMVQKEVADRIVSKPGTKVYGALSVAVQYYCHVHMVMKVPAGAFMPCPKVDSAVLRLTPKSVQDVQAKNQALYFKVVRGAFGQRRKTLLNALSSVIPLTKPDLQAAILQAGIDPGCRGETLDLHQFATLSNAIGERL